MFIENKDIYQNYYNYVNFWFMDKYKNNLFKKYKDFDDDNNLFLAIKTKKFMIDDDLIKYLNYVNFIKCLKYVSKHKKFKLSVIIDKDIKKTLIKLIF
jgi:hypothetical protein